jgi:hypothetical protein
VNLAEGVAVVQPSTIRASGFLPVMSSAAERLKAGPHLHSSNTKIAIAGPPSSGAIRSGSRI